MWPAHRLLRVCDLMCAHHQLEKRRVETSGKGAFIWNSECDLSKSHEWTDEKLELWRLFNFTILVALP